ncbi:N-6 DNA methylase [Ferrovum sp. JA12]|uniref:Eco57I restriction-modification methylase domain-containing protein n=1 Tax=Ferrovum sp. JA12 TaxID=1356299 RepID=UPI000702427E|nr:DNA methyltransferase [Ferrovum sp. JA12]KRH78329.1 N-6 DNA methylase [Ferrovum sp. JA12]
MSRTSTVLHVDTLSIEGGLFTSEWLAKVSAQQAAMQADADYGVRAGFNLREEIGFAWRSAQTLWRQFDQARQQHNSDAWGISQHFAAELLRQCFAFSLAKQTKPIVIAERNYPVQFSALNGHVPIVISPHDEVKALDVAHDRLGDNSGERIRKRSAFGLLQESLNAMPDALWGIATNGLQLRIARDNASLTRPAWVEVDLERLFAEERYADFSVMWLLLHSSRFGSSGSNSTDCALEQWRNACREQGTRARETLRGGVEEALLELGQGFVSHPANTALRDALATGTLSSHEYLRELLRLVYRQIFLLTVEEREILHRSDADPSAVALYADGYSLQRLRERAIRRSAHDRHGDLWQALRQVWIGLGVGEPLLALPPLGGLFDSNQCPSLDACKLENRFLLSALFHLAWLRPEANAPLTRVNWRDMGPEELGSIYESLLELVPMLSNDHRQFSFHTGAATRGNARKTSGSYYTHDSLVQVQLESALEPVIASTLESHPVGQDAVDALLALSVIDPACGSGHFLLAAARRIAGHLARVRAQMRDAHLGNSGQPTPEDYRHALRDVVTHCVYGVDMNPMALELARMALWLEGYTPDAPLGFIDHHFLLGNGLLGVMDPKMILDGVPDTAFTALTGDDAALCRDLKRRNRTERTGLLRMREAASFSQSLQSMDLSATALPLQQLDVLPDETLAEIAAKRQAYERLQLDAGTDGLSLALNLYCASYLLPKHGTETDTDVPTTQDVMNALLGQTVSERKKQAAFNLAKRVPLLHWRLGFAQVFARGGFSVILANPPWERMKLQEEEYFAERAPAVAEARNKAERERAIRALGLSAPGSPERRIYDDFNAAKQIAEAGSVFCHGPRYPLTGTGDVNTYALFAETALQILHPQGRAGLVLPSGIATDDSTSAFFGEISKGRIVQLVDFENREGLFAGVHRSFKFCLLTIGSAEAARFAFFLGNTEQLKDPRRSFTLTADDIARLNPNTRTCPVFRSQKDAEITSGIYKRVPVLWDESKPDGNPWGIKFMTMFHMSGDSGLFHDARRKSELTAPVPLYEAKMVHQFDHRWATYVGDTDDSRDMTDEEKADVNRAVQPRYWIENSVVDDKLKEKNWDHPWIYGWRGITNATNERSVIGSIVPRYGAGNSLHLLLSHEIKHASLWSCFSACISSLVFDYCARTKIGGTNFNFFIPKQLPLLAPKMFTTAYVELIVPRVLELLVTSKDMLGYYLEVVNENPLYDPRSATERGKPWIWNPDHRAILRSELDAIYARLYGLTRDDLRYILDPSDIMGDDYPSETFRGLKAKEIRHLGEYRTRRLVLEAWDKLEQGEL